MTAMAAGGLSTIDDIVRRNVAMLRSRANLTQQGLADEMLLRGLTWSRETVAQVETTSRRITFVEAIALAASLDVPLARLVSTSAEVVSVGESEWTSAYVGAAMAGTAGDVFTPEAYAGGASTSTPTPATPTSPAAQGPVPPGSRATRGDVAPGPVPPGGVERRNSAGDRRRTDDSGEPRRPGRRSTDFAVAPGDWDQPAPVVAEAPSAAVAPGSGPQRTAERIERRMRTRVTASDVDATAQQLWARSLEAERERRVADRLAVAGGSPKTVQGHITRDLDRELAFELERRAEAGRQPAMTPEEVTWESTRLHIMLANKGYDNEDVETWWHDMPHRELGGLTVAQAWDAGEYRAVGQLIRSLPARHG